MKSQQQEIIDLLIRLVDEFNSFQTPGLSKDFDARIFGPRGVLDSQGLVMFIVMVEQALEEKYGKKHDEQRGPDDDPELLEAELVPGLSDNEGVHFSKSPYG